MLELTIILMIATFVLFGTRLKWKDYKIDVLTMTVAVCAMGQIFLDTSITSAQVPYCLIPILVVLIFAGIGLMNLSSGKHGH